MFRVSTVGYFEGSKLGYIHCYQHPHGNSMDGLIAEFLREHDECSILHIAIIEKVS